MKILNLLNPQKWIGQIIVLGFFVAIGVILGLKMQEPCPPSTSIAIQQKNKARKGSTVTNSLSDLVTPTDCQEWLKGLSMGEIRKIRKD